MVTKEVKEEVKKDATYESFIAEGYEVGLKIHINHMEDPYANYDGREGVIRLIDSRGQLHGTWGGCALIPEIDDFDIIEEKKIISIKKELNEDFNSNNFASDFEGTSCKLTLGQSEFYIEYELNFIDEDFNFDDLHITKCVYWNNHDCAPRMNVNRWYKDWLRINYYDLIYDAYVKSLIDEAEYDW